MHKVEHQRMLTNCFSTLVRSGESSDQRDLSVRPSSPPLRIYQLENGEYQPGKVFRGHDRIESRLFPNLALTVEAIFAMGR